MNYLSLILVIFSSAPATANELSFLLYRAPTPLDWSSPGRLVQSMTNNLGAEVNGTPYPHPISHVNIRLQCGKSPAVYRGMTSIKSNGAYLWDFIVRGSSLDTILINQQGRSYEAAEILHWWPLLRERNYTQKIRFLLSGSQCARLQRYLHLYRSTGLENIYGGLRSEPLRGQGAGCSAFAVSLLQVLGVSPEQRFPSWHRELRIPLTLLSTQEQRAAISFLGYLRGRDRGWASPKEPHIVLRFWDPELMFLWAQKKSAPVDLRSQPLPNTAILPLNGKTFRQTVRYHYENRRRLLTKEEILNISPKKCRNFQVCD